MSTKTRKRTPKAILDAVLDEYRHRCAVCGKEKPQLHHIDEDPSNNVPDNLIPLCPNHHLTDQHDPTAPVDREKLRFFRRHKDPAILNERFVPLWRRCAFILNAETAEPRTLHGAAAELYDFVRELQSGTFYATRLRPLVGPFSHDRSRGVVDDKAAREYSVEAVAIAEAESDRNAIIRNRDPALELIVELLRYQNWLPDRSRFPAKS